MYFFVKTWRYFYNKYLRSKLICIRFYLQDIFKLQKLDLKFDSNTLFDPPKRQSSTPTTSFLCNLIFNFQKIVILSLLSLPPVPWAPSFNILAFFLLLGFARSWQLYSLLGNDRTLHDGILLVLEEKVITTMILSDYDCKCLGILTIKLLRFVMYCSSFFF